MEVADKLEILTDAAKYDVACTSSGVDRDARLGRLGNACCEGICHSFAADGRCITLLKVLLTNFCIYDCAYCANRRGNDIPRAAFTPRELADLTIAFYRRNYIEGLFLSSGVVRDPDYTMEALCATLSLLRDEYEFNGYIHAKAIPGASPELIERLGLLADRVSVNVELPSEKSLKVLAPEKTTRSVTEPMGLIASRAAQNKAERALSHRQAQRFAPAGQSTQLIVGVSPETDYDILNLSSSLYRSYDLKRVFFSAYLPRNDDALLPDCTVEVPLNREHRLYQADWLMRFYEFDVGEIIDEQHPFLDPLLDPKANWALNHLDRFPVEINTAPYEMLLRVPGLGVLGAKRVIRARRHRSLTHESLVSLGLKLKRMQYFIVCSGQYHAPLAFEHDAIRTRLAADADPAGRHRRSGGVNQVEGQLSLFDSPELTTAEATALLPTSVADTATGAWPLQLGQARAFQAQAQRLALLEGHAAGSKRLQPTSEHGIGTAGADTTRRRIDRSARQAS